MPDTFYLVDNDPELENVDVATNATTVATAFTRYTVAPTTVFSQSTRMTGCVNFEIGLPANALLLFVAFATARSRVVGT